MPTALSGREPSQTALIFAPFGPWFTLGNFPTRISPEGAARYRRTGAEPLNRITFAFLASPFSFGGTSATIKDALSGFLASGRSVSDTCREESTVDATQHEINLARQWVQAATSGDFTSAWAISDILRNQGIDYSSRDRWCRPLWDGSLIDGRHVLIRCWRGLGDAIQFIRYAPLIRARASSLTIEAPPPLIPLFRSVPGIDQLIALDQPHPQVTDYLEIESTELPYVFRSTLNTIPRTVPYFDLPGYASEPGKRQLNIGLCWCGGSYDLRRAMHLSDLEPLSKLREVNFFQLQRGNALRQTLEVSMAFRNPSDHSMDLGKTALLINSLDLIVSVDTMVAHLAGALGKRVYLLLHADADWRWLKERDDSPWYPTMKLFRQSNAGDWTSVVNELMEDLAEIPR